MTTAELLIKYNKQQWRFHLKSYPVPKDVVPILLRWVDKPFYDIEMKDVEDYILGMKGTGYDYYYEIDYDTKEVKAWDSQWYWVNAPKDWEAKGWKGLWEENGRLGYRTQRRGKAIDISKYVFEHVL